jgi:hypothetical protein
MSENQGSLQSRPSLSKNFRDIDSWRAIHEKAVGEMDLEQLLPLVHASEAALYARWHETSGLFASEPELRDMKCACDDLLTIKVRRLGWPDFRV